MVPPSGLLALLSVLSVLHVPSCVGQDPRIAKDEQNNIHLNTSQRVFVNGRDVLADLSTLTASLSAAQSALQAQSALTASLRAQVSQLVSFSPLNKVFVVSSAGVFRFDGSSWVSAPQTNIARSNALAASFMSSIYVAGGLNDTSYLNSVERFDGSVWTSAPPMTRARSSGCLINFQGKLFAIGGFAGSQAILRHVETFDGSVWANAPELLTPRYSFGCTLFQNEIFVVGGISLFSMSGVERFNGNSWTDAKALSSPRGMLCAAVLNGFLYAIGGFVTTNTTVLAVAERLDSATNVWAPVQFLNVPRSTASCVTYRNTIHVFGGTGPLAGSTSEYLNESSWTSGSSLPTIIQNSVAVILT